MWHFAHLKVGSASRLPTSSLRTLFGFGLMWHPEPPHVRTGTLIVLSSSRLMAVMLMWQAVQPRALWWSSSCWKVAVSRRSSLRMMSGSVIPAFAAVCASASLPRGCGTAFPCGRSLWQPAQSDESGRSPPSCQCQLKQESWPVGVVLNTPSVARTSAPAAGGAAGFASAFAGG